VSEKEILDQIVEVPKASAAKDKRAMFSKNKTKSISDILFGKGKAP
jgi:hypothetical protein